MSEPLIFVFNMTLQEGKEDDYKAYADELIEFVEKNEPRLISSRSTRTMKGPKPRTYSFTRTQNPRTSICKSRLDKIKEGYLFVDFARVTIDDTGSPAMRSCSNYARWRIQVLQCE